MFKITVEATTEKDKELLDELLCVLCYGLTEEQDIKLRTKGFELDGYSGGDDAYFGLSGKSVRVERKK